MVPLGRTTGSRRSTSKVTTQVGKHTEPAAIKEVKKRWRGGGTTTEEMSKTEFPSSLYLYYQTRLNSKNYISTYNIVITRQSGLQVLFQVGALLTNICPLVTAVLHRVEFRRRRRTRSLDAGAHAELCGPFAIFITANFPLDAHRENHYTP